MISDEKPKELATIMDTSGVEGEKTPEALQSSKKASKGAKSEPI